MVKVEGETKVKRRLFSWYHPNDLCPTRVTMLERARTDALSDEQKKAFKIFKELLADTEQINGFSIMDKSHRINSQPEFRSLLIRILNSNQFKEV